MNTKMNCFHGSSVLIVCRMSKNELGILMLSNKLHSISKFIFEERKLIRPPEIHALCTAFLVLTKLPTELDNRLASRLRETWLMAGFHATLVLP